MRQGKRIVLGVSGSIAAHKAMGSRAVTEGVERGLAGVGLLWLLGSPVTVVAER